MFSFSSFCHLKLAIFTFLASYFCSLKLSMFLFLSFCFCFCFCNLKLAMFLILAFTSAGWSFLTCYVLVLSLCCCCLKLAMFLFFAFCFCLTLVSLWTMMKRLLDHRRPEKKKLIHKWRHRANREGCDYDTSTLGIWAWHRMSKKVQICVTSLTNDS